jgi:hypothetical protein
VATLSKAIVMKICPSESRFVVQSGDGMDREEEVSDVLGAWL